MIDTARKAVASFLTVITGWAVFVLQSDAAQITGGEIGLLIGGLTTVAVTWLVPNSPPAPWNPPERGRGDAGTSEFAIGVVLGIAATLAWLAFFGPTR